MLIPLLCCSQDDTGNKVILDFEIGKFIALDLEELDRLKEVDTINRSLISNLKAQVEVFKEVSQSKSNQINLLQETKSVLEAQLEAEKLNKPKSKWLVWTLAVISAGGTGYIIGNAL